MSGRKSAYLIIEGKFFSDTEAAVSRKRSSVTAKKIVPKRTQISVICWCSRSD